MFYYRELGGGAEGQRGKTVDILIKVPANFVCSFLCISHRTLDVRQKKYSVPPSAVRHRSSLDYTSDAATVQGKTGVINYAAVK